MLLCYCVTMLLGISNAEPNRPHVQYNSCTRPPPPPSPKYLNCKARSNTPLSNGSHWQTIILYNLQNILQKFTAAALAWLVSSPRTTYSMASHFEAYIQFSLPTNCYKVCITGIKNSWSLCRFRPTTDHWRSEGFSHLNAIFQQSVLDSRYFRKYWIESRCDWVFKNLSRLALVSSEPPIKWVPGLSRSSKVVGERRWPASPSGLEVKKKSKSIPLLPHCVFTSCSRAKSNILHT